MSDQKITYIFVFRLNFRTTGVPATLYYKQTLYYQGFPVFSVFPTFTAIDRNSNVIFVIRIQLSTMWVRYPQSCNTNNKYFFRFSVKLTKTTITFKLKTIFWAFWKKCEICVRSRQKLRALPSYSITRCTCTICFKITVYVIM